MVDFSGVVRKKRQAKKSIDDSGEFMNISHAHIVLENKRWYTSYTNQYTLRTHLYA
jgi:hypothetical protein